MKRIVQAHSHQARIGTRNPIHFFPFSFISCTNSSRTAELPIRIWCQWLFFFSGFHTFCFSLVAQSGRSRLRRVDSLLRTDRLCSPQTLIALVSVLLVLGSIPFIVFLALSSTRYSCEGNAQFTPVSAGHTASQNFRAGQHSNQQRVRLPPPQHSVVC